MARSRWALALACDDSVGTREEPPMSGMSERAQGHRLGDALLSVLSEREGAARYEQYQREIRNGTAQVADGPRPREFDESGFPIPQRNTSFLERVARLLSPP
jgi:hypothetical protein